MPPTQPFTTNIPSLDNQQTEPHHSHAGATPEPITIPTPAEPTQSSSQAEPTPTLNTSDLITHSIPPERHSSRPKQPPAWHKDYVMSAQVNHPTSTNPRKRRRLLRLQVHMHLLRPQQAPQSAFRQSLRSPLNLRRGQFLRRLFTIRNHR